MQPKSRKEMEVWQACDQLASENNLITYQGVGDRLVKLGYRRGSNSDIHRYLTTWKKMKQRTKVSSTAIPTSLPFLEGDPIASAVEQFKQEIWESANQEMEVLRAALAEKEAKIRKLEVEPIEATLMALTQSRDVELLRLYDHHQAQFDRYLKAISTVRERNNKLSAQIRYMQLEYEAALEKMRLEYESKLKDYKLKKIAEELL
jgi:hypothetical protein